MYLAAAEVSRGWGGPLGLAAAAAIFFFVVVPIYERVRAHSPTKALPRGARVKALVKPVPDTDGTDLGTYWDRISSVTGKRVRRAGQVWRTGSSEPPNGPVDELADDELDLALDEPEPAEETLEAWVERVDRQGLAYAEIVRQGMARFGKSERTVKRRIADLRAAGRGAAEEIAR